MITSILLFVGGLSAGIILGGFGGFAISNGVAKLRHVKARNELPDDELYREAYNEVAELTGDVKVRRRKMLKWWRKKCQLTMTFRYSPDSIGRL